MGSSRKKWGKSSDQNRSWDEWQKYIKRETQRLRQKSGGNVVEVKFNARRQSETSEEPALEPEAAREVSEGRQPPVPGVPREEALQVSDDTIGSTVRPFTVNDYKNIKPLNSPDLFDSGISPVEDYIEPVPASDDPSTVEEAGLTPVVTDEPEKSQVEVIKDPVKDKTRSKKKKGKKNSKKGSDGELELFGSVSEHQVVSRQRLTRRSRVDREELIEKLLDPVISLEEAATLIGVCKTTVRRYTNQNQLACLRTPGMQRRFKLSQVLEFVKKREDEQKSRKVRKKKD